MKTPNPKTNKTKRPLILISNDDGVHATGIKILTEIAQKYGDVVVVAPSSGQSGKSHAITFANPLRIWQLHQDKHLQIYKTSGTPSDSVKMARHLVLKNKKIDLLLSGINHGSNTSASTLYSGTVGAALEGCLNQIPSIAFSIVNYKPTYDFQGAAMVADKVIAVALNKGLPQKTCLNINIPNVPAEELKGYKITRQANNYWVEYLEERQSPNGQSYYWLDGELKEIDKGRDTDIWAIKHNYVSITPIYTDMTAYHALDELKKWKIK